MLVIKINSVEKTDLIDWSSFAKSEVLTNQVDTLEFEMKNYGAKIYKPNILDVVEVWNGSTKIFGGMITNIDEVVKGRVFRRKIKCKDYSQELDRKCVVETYTSQTVNAIIADILATYCPGFTAVNVSCSLTVDFIAFNYEQPSKCLQQLAELFNYDWYIDYDKDVHFFSKESNLAPFDLDDTSGKFVWDSLVLNRKADQIRNVIYVRGGEYKGSSYTETKISVNGSETVFTFGYKYADISVTKGGAAQTVGIDFIHDPALYDCLYNFNEKAIKFRSDNKPGAGVAVAITGLPYIPVIVKIQENASVALYGEYEFKIIDNSIDSKEGARQRAKAELYAYADQISEGNFRSYETGLKVGQKIHLNSVVWGYDEWFTINRIDSIIRKPDTGEMEHTCSLVTTRTMGMIEILQKLLTMEDKKIEIKKDEVLDKIETVQEEVSITELVTKYANISIAEAISVSENVRRDPWGAGVINLVLGPYTPTGDSDSKRPIWLDRGAWIY
ncbi:hypothetical protein HZB93_03040 [Candidatus Falkowbacteria bacterium]|nr:hypothetical protein [Candidatus Falkowbacteria bacterium]